MKRLAVLGALVLPMLCLLTAIGGLGAASSYQHNHALALQAEAALTQAQVTQSLVSTQQALLVFVGIVVVLLIIETAVGAWVLLRGRNVSQQKWAPGPNARWGRVGDAKNAPLPDTQTLLTLALMERLLPPQSSQPQQLPAGGQVALAAPAEDAEDDDFWPWWWAQQG